MSIINKVTALLKRRHANPYIVEPTADIAVEGEKSKRRTMPRTIRDGGKAREQRTSNYVAKRKKGYNQVKDIKAGRSFNKGVRK
ncbi:MAG: hypothetical protein BA870_10855 [Desulfuromonadales bacterium C00003094]|jgi:hypothetical protein|nr:MAG: hypothetical protein BA870_10855 [Desulfuromonadales bacterium C00003094]